MCSLLSVAISKSDIRGQFSRDFDTVKPLISINDRSGFNNFADQTGIVFSHCVSSQGVGLAYFHELVGLGFKM